MKPFSILKRFAIVLTLAFAPLTISTAQAAVKVASYVGTWKPGTVYGAGDLITYSNKTFISLVAKNKAKDPTKNPKVWQVLGGVGGVTGLQGLPGVQGVAGAQGAAGTNGIAGAKGDTGLTGVNGVAGSQGLPGSNGAAGSQGLPGVKGDAGSASVVPGPAGVAGSKGDTGQQGAAGIQGATGSQGLPGAAGSNGLKGDAGPAGTGPVGTATGDMQWWNGSVWVMFGVGANNTTLKNCDGIPTWVVNSCPFIVGDTGPAGGKVFYLTDATGLHGLEAAPADQSAGIQWGCYLTVVGGTSTAIGTGKANTTAINAQCGTGTAASIAASYSLNSISDWYLPSKDELNLLYAQKNVVGGFVGNRYWSSTQFASDFAWLQLFLGGYQQSSLKFNPDVRVRAVRAF